MTAVGTKGQGTLALTNPADQNLIKSTAMSTLTLTPTGGALGATYTISVYSGTLPAGLTLAMAGDNLSATVTGTPTTAQSSATVRFLVVASSGERVITTGNSWHVADTLAIANGLDSATTIEATKSTAWSYQLYSTGGRGTITWTKATGTYPAGLSLSTDGVISGTPSATGSQVLTFTATDQNSSTATTANVTITVNDVLAVSTSSFSWTEDTIEADSATATGGTDPITWTLNADSEFLPDGLVKLTETTNKSCVIVGRIPSGYGSGTNFTLKATDANGATATGLVTVLVST
jgi:hypothetical protein